MTQVPDSRSLASFLNPHSPSMTREFSFGRFDTNAPVQHPTCVLTFVRRLASVLAVLTLCVGNLAACAGGSTPEARLDCCTQDEACPMAPSGADSRTASMVTQSQADSCCAASGKREPGASVSTFVLSATLSVAPSPLPATVPAFHAGVEGWRALIPVPRAAVPKHLLLSVFLL